VPRHPNLTPSYSSKAEYPVFQRLTVLINALEYWVARSSRAKTAPPRDDNSPCPTQRKRV
jgi:hypothetical protein